MIDRKRLNQCKHNLNTIGSSSKIPDSTGVWLLQLDYDLTMVPIEIFEESYTKRLYWVGGEDKNLYVDSENVEEIGGKWAGKYITPYEYAHIVQDMEYLIGQLDQR